MTYVLIIFWFAYSGLGVHTQEFNSLAACRKAAVAVVELSHNEAEAICVAKGAPAPE